MTTSNKTLPNLRVITLLLCALTSNMFAIDSEVKTPGTETNITRPGSSTSWDIGVGNAAESDNKYVEIPANGISANKEYTDYYAATNFNLNIPNGMEVKGISVSIERGDENNAKDDVVSLLKNGSVVGENKALASAWSSETTKIYGGDDDTWGETWSASEVNNANFGIAFSVKKAGNGANPKPQIDKISISISYGASPLPIELLDFNAIRNNHTTVITWSTGSETNNEYFVIEKSTNTVEWDEITTVEGQINSSQLQHYSFSDLGSNEVNTYYRLKQVDTDNSFSYSSVIQLSSKPTNKKVTVAGNTFLFENVSTDPLQLFILDMNGRILHEEQINGSKTVEPKNLKAGVYLYWVKRNHTTIAQGKFIQH